VGLQFLIALIVPYSVWVVWTEIWGQTYGPDWNDMLSLGQVDILSDTVASLSTHITYSF
jgi:hypothetical protein